MMMNAYHESYIEDAACNLGEYLDYMVHDLGYDIDEAFSLFAFSKIGYSFGKGNPSYVTGMSGVELARKIIFELTQSWVDKTPTQTVDRSCEYWVGWILAKYQWSTAIPFSRLIENDVKASDLQERYILHEADFSKTKVVIDCMMMKEHEQSRLKRLRKYAGMTQQRLSEKSGVSLRMIQLYEQGQNDLAKAQANVIFALANAIGCQAEDLL